MKAVSAFICSTILMAFNLFKGVSFGLGGLIQLQNLPPGLIETLISSKNAWSNDGQREISAFASIHNLVRQSTFPAWMT